MLDLSPLNPVTDWHRSLITDPNAVRGLYFSFLNPDGILKDNENLFDFITLNLSQLKLGYWNEPDFFYKLVLKNRTFILSNGIFNNFGFWDDVATWDDGVEDNIDDWSDSMDWNDNLDWVEL